jgi:hypothetical protein
VACGAFVQTRLYTIFESCNQEGIKNAMETFVEIGVIHREGKYLELAEKYQADESQLIDMLELVNKFRQSA